SLLKPQAADKTVETDKTDTPSKASPAKSQPTSERKVAASAATTEPTQTAKSMTPQSWLTLVEIRTPSEAFGPGVAQNRFERTMMAVALVVALIAGMVSGVGWLLSARARKPFRPADAYEVVLRRDGVNLERPDAQLCGELCKSAQGLVFQVHESLDQLQGVAPLKRTLTREIRDLETYLGTLVASAPDGEQEWRRMRAKLQRVVNDMMRLRDIVESAERSLKSAPSSRGLPRDRDEAFEALGANPTTSEKILKKLVDALRATWHPDLATDDEDRRAREDRIKQINVAWDLISGKRIEA
ncbi:MAG: J domain-containing protein, partial [Pseudomonadota bacterium]